MMSQFGNGMKAFRGPAMQRGYGLGGLFKGLARSFAPVLKRGLITMGKKALKTGVEVLGDVAQGRNLKEALKNRTMQTVTESINDVRSKIPVSRKRTITKRRSQNVKRQKRDIFN